ncbi:MAG: phytoene desaturase [Myxococcales bacterium]|nr:phytoene desaturase [Myxococcales bacterium]
MPDVVVVGGGVGGLAAAIELAAAGERVLVLEAADRPGGKAGTVTLDGVEVDTGPSVLTLPHVFDELCALAGTRLRDELALRAPEPAFRYLWPDGVALDVHVAREATLASVEHTLGAGAARELAGFLRYAERLWSTAAPAFVYGDAPSLGRLVARGPGVVRELVRIDPLRSLAGAIRARVREPHLRTLLLRYATYNGSDARRAPATLGCIAHVELALGGYGVEGGMYELVRALVRVAERAGATLRLGAPVARILRHADGSVRGVALVGGEHILAPRVVSNADPAHLATALLGERPRHGLRLPRTPSTSGYTAILKAARRPGGATSAAAPVAAQARVAHTVLVPGDYGAELSDLFDRDAPPADPTVYLCAAEACHGRRGWADHEPVFVMANAPAEPATGARDEATWPALRERVMRRLLASGLAGDGDELVWERTPADLALRFPGSRGALYGAASNDRSAAFRRPANAVAAIPGLFVASGGAHPGGGLPLAALSGRAAARALLASARRPSASLTTTRHPHEEPTSP